MRKITYNALYGRPVSDGEAEIYALQMHERNQDFEVSTENLIHATRVLIREGKIPLGSVCFIFEGQELHPDKDGRLAHWPRGFCAFTDDYLSRLMFPIGSPEHDSAAAVYKAQKEKWKKESDAVMSGCCPVDGCGGHMETVGLEDCNGWQCNKCGHTHEDIASAKMQEKE